MGCDLCGNPAVFGHYLIEGTELDVCKECSRYGTRAPPKRQVDKLLAEKQAQDQRRFQMELPEEKEALVEGYGRLIRAKREKLGINQLQLGRMVAERESIINKIESEDFTPSLVFAKRLEKALKIKLVEESKNPAFIQSREEQTRSSRVLTLGDVIKMKKR